MMHRSVQERGDFGSEGMIILERVRLYVCTLTDATSLVCVCVCAHPSKSFSKRGMSRDSQLILRSSTEANPFVRIAKTCA